MNSEKELLKEDHFKQTFCFVLLPANTSGREGRERLSYLCHLSGWIKTEAEDPVDLTVKDMPMSQKE